MHCKYNLCHDVTHVFIVFLVVFFVFHSAARESRRVICDTVVVRSALLFHTAQVILHTWTAEGKPLVTHNTPR